MSKVRYHRDGSKTVWFDNGNKVHFQPAAKSAAKKRKITGTPYIFAPGPKIDLPSGIANGMLFEYRGKPYVAVAYRGVDRMLRNVNVAYGQPIRLTRPVR